MGEILFGRYRNRYFTNTIQSTFPLFLILEWIEGEIRLLEWINQLGIDR